MSKYTTEVRFICETSAGLINSVGYNSIDKVLDVAIPKIFDFNYPIFDENYRNVLERKIIKHYYTREICAETVGLWKHFLSVKMNEIMPYYNQLYKSELLAFNPLYDVDLTRDRKGSEAKIGKSETANTGTVRDTGTLSRTRTDNLTEVAQDSGSDQNINKNTRWDIYSDTPQGSLTNVQNEAYLTNARKITDDGTGSSLTYGKRTQITNTGTQGTTGSDTNTRTLNTKVNGSDQINTTDEFIEHVKGKNGGVSYSKLLKEFRETFLNIDMLIIEDLSELFFGLW